MTTIFYFMIYYFSSYISCKILFYSIRKKEYNLKYKEIDRKKIYKINTKDNVFLISLSLLPFLNTLLFIYKLIESTYYYRTSKFIEYNKILKCSRCNILSRRYELNSSFFSDCPHCKNKNIVFISTKYNNSFILKHTPELSYSQINKYLKEKIKSEKKKEQSNLKNKELLNEQLKIKEDEKEILEVNNQQLKMINKLNEKERFL